jgi:hypothetical protein
MRCILARNGVFELLHFDPLSPIRRIAKMEASRTEQDCGWNDGKTGSPASLPVKDGEKDLAYDFTRQIGSEFGRHQVGLTLFLEL